MEFLLKNVLSYGQEISHTFKIGPTNWPEMTSLAASGRLQNVTKYYIKVHKTGPGGSPQWGRRAWPLVGDWKATEAERLLCFRA